MHTTTVYLVRLCLPITFGFIAFGAFTQEVKVFDRELSLGMTGSANHSFRYLRSDGSPNATVTVRDDIEIPAWRYSVAVMATYSLSDHWALESGLQYASKGYDTEKIELLTWMREPDLADAIALSYRNNYLDIPIRANYFITKSRIRPYVMAGALVSIHLKSYVISNYYYEEGTTSQSRDEDSGYGFGAIGATAGIGVDYRINQSVRLRVEPAFKTNLTPIVYSVPVKCYLYDFGLWAGFFIRLS